MITVSQLTARLKDLLEDDASLRDLWLQGEVSNFSRAASGHCYFTLKDPRSAMACVMWRSAAQRLTRTPQNGELVVAHGQVSLYEAQGRVQFYADRLEPAGLGQLYQQLEALKNRLEEEGLFRSERKRPLPLWPARIGIVTSPQAAALRDILRTVAHRYPLVQVLLAPTMVQGVEAPAQIVAAIELLNHWSLGVEPIDLIILARGGGSIEELWAFNDERVVRAVANSALPVVSGVGHETDFTLVDFVADVRAPTPTGAATAAVPDRQDLLGQVQALRSRAYLAMSSNLATQRAQWSQQKRLLSRSSPLWLIAGQRQQVDDLSRAAERSLRHQLDLWQTQLASLEARLGSLSPQAVLARGYAVVRQAANGEVVTTVDQVQAGDRLRILVSNGEFESTVTQAEGSRQDGRSDL